MEGNSGSSLDSSSDSLTLSKHDILLLSAGYTRRAIHLLQSLHNTPQINVSNYKLDDVASSGSGSDTGSRSGTGLELIDMIKLLNKVESGVNSLLDTIVIDINKNQIEHSGSMKQIALMEHGNSIENTTANTTANSTNSTNNTNSNNSNSKRKHSNKDNLDKSEQPPRKKNKDKNKSNESTILPNTNNTITMFH